MWSDFVSTPFLEGHVTDQEYMADKEKKFETRTFIYFGLAFMAIGLFLHLQPNLLIGLPVTHADYAKELELTLLWGSVSIGLGAAIFGLMGLWWLCDYFEPSYKELFEGGQHGPKAIDQE